MFLVLEKKLGLDIVKKIYNFYIDIVLLDIREKIKIRDKYLVMGNCCFIIYEKNNFICSPRFMNWFYRNNGTLKKDNMQIFMNY